MIFSKIENFLANNIEGFFNKKFSSQLEFDELIKIIERTINQHKQKIDEYYFIPNKYVISLHEKDFKNLQDDDASNKLRSWIFYYVIINNYYMNGLPDVHFLASQTLKLGICEIKPYFTKSLEGSNNIDQGTIIISPNQFEDIEKEIRADKEIARLNVISGDDINSSIVFGTSQIHIGRREQNEFIISDPNASRIHAYISFEHGRHIIYDAHSKNGTRVNNSEIKAICLNNDDIITIGNTSIIYNVIER